MAKNNGARLHPETLHAEPCDRYVALNLDHTSRRLFRCMDRRTQPQSQASCPIGQNVAEVDLL